MGMSCTVPQSTFQPLMSTVAVSPMAENDADAGTDGFVAAGCAVVGEVVDGGLRAAIQGQRREPLYR